MNRPDSTLTLSERLYLGNYHTCEKNYGIKNLLNDLKFIVSKFGIDSYISLAAMTGFAKYIFRSYSSISV